MNTNDTIAAIATAPGDAGISIVRVSGGDALKIADAIFRCSGAPPSQRPANTFVHGYVHSAESPRGKSGDIDEAILLIYRAPQSYTREDVIEIQGHGGATSARRILRAALDADARHAEPGEFTRRAFLSGRIDLLQAEAVMDLIRARSDRAAHAAMEQLEGALSRSVTAVYDCLLQVAGDLEATLDFGEDELPEATMADLNGRLTTVRERLTEILGSWDEGHLLREGAVVVISGCPNVGKSTLLNALLGSDRAIVTHRPGTTRDTLEEQLVLGGIPVRLIDTAGLRDADCAIEIEGIRRAREHIERADINLWVVDGSRILSEEERAHISARDRARCIVVINKADLGKAVRSSDFPGLTAISCGAKDGSGLDSLRCAIIEKLGVTSTATPHATISERHRRLVKRALNDIKEAAALLASGREDVTVMAADVVRTALEALGEITGRTYHNELLDNVFSRFCVGK